jgi:hypothetical protein
MHRDGRIEMNTKTKWLLGLVGLLLASCVSYQPMESNYDAIRAELEPGDRVDLRLNSGEEISIEVTEIRETEISGDTNTSVVRGEIVTIPLADIQELVLVDRGYETAAQTGMTLLGVLSIVGIIIFFTIFP